MSCDNINITTGNDNTVNVISQNNNIIAVNECDCSIVNIPQSVTTILQVNSPGPQGAMPLPIGPDGAVQFKSGSVFGGEQGLRYDYINDVTIISGSGYNTILQVHSVNDEPWAFGIYNDTYNPNQSVLAGWVNNTGEANIGTEVEKPLYIYTNANYGSPTLTISSSGVTIANALIVTNGITGSLQGTASYALTASYQYPIAVEGSTLYSINPPAGPGLSNDNNIALGAEAGYNATIVNDSIFLGRRAGYYAFAVYNSNFFGFNAGQFAYNAYYSNFLGPEAGTWAEGAYESNFLGGQAGMSASNAWNSNFLGTQAGYQATNADSSNFLGVAAGQLATNAANSNFLGNASGLSATNANNSNFIGSSAGYLAINADSSNFLGPGAGFNATNAGNSNFFGASAGNEATNAFQSNFIGSHAGDSATSASRSTLIGTGVGWNLGGGTGIGSNNIIIGANITLPNGTKDSINLGGIIFATGSWSSFINQSSGSANGRVGINVVSPTFNFQVSGSVGFPNLATSASVTNIVTINPSTGQLYYTASSAIGSGGGTPGGSNTQIQFNANGAFSGSSALTFDSGSNTLILTGSLTVTQNISASSFTGSLFGTASFATTASYALNAGAGGASSQTGSFGASWDGQGGTVTTGNTIYKVNTVSGSIRGWNILATGTNPTCTIDVWKVASGTSLPTVTNSITGSSAPALSTGNAVRSTTLTGWTTALTPGDIFAFNINAVSAATKIFFNIEYL